MLAASLRTHIARIEADYTTVREDRKSPAPCAAWLSVVCADAGLCGNASVAHAASAKCNRISVTVLAERAPVAQSDPALDLLARGGDSTADKKFTILCLSCSPSASISSCVRRSGPMGLMNKVHSCLICRARLASTELPV